MPMVHVGSNVIVSGDAETAGWLYLMWLVQRPH